MKLYTFNNLIRKYSVPFHFVAKTKGRYESGKWNEGDSVLQESAGAIVPMAESKVRQSGGVYTSKDRQLYMTHRIPTALQGAQICYKGDLYSIESELDYEDYAGVFIYTLKWVSLFDREVDENA